MSTIMPQNELHRRAVQWINDEKRERPRASLSSLVDEAGMRFNLGPQDCKFLLDFFKEEKEKK